MDTPGLEQSPSIARAAGVEGVEVHTGTADAGQHPRRIFSDYVLLVARGSYSTTIDCAHHVEKIPETALVMVEPETVVTISAQERFAYHALYISPATFRAIFASAPGDPSRVVALPQLYSDDPVIIRTFLAVHDALATARNAIEAQVALLHLLFGLLGAGLLERLPGTQSHPAVISRAREHIRADFSRGMSLDELSRRVGMCKFALVRAFTREFGLPPHTYQTYLRVMRARTLIRDGRPISDVAFEVGFSDQSHLNRHFRRMLGYTPGSYARQMGAGNSSGRIDARLSQ